MEIRYASSNKDVKNYDTVRLREEYLIENLFLQDEIKLVYSHIDRIIVGGAFPIEKAIELKSGKELGSDFFLKEES
ncbi:hypothetical protein C095_08750 [Fusobacterium necrophorum subsp. funduliforme B35]|uniref:5-dehydro-4-deoxy-D-glucuronate isomerase n=1 Tax=Fusobacterium necrophorum subsp. funduliforme B35 TaxID=1226633 RepID=A0A0B4EHL4_9FUSO|nr:hypothetical protein C095_08750 [Fusobacterium necrophorum subsp. funduliforme B35]